MTPHNWISLSGDLEHAGGESIFDFKAPRVTTSGLPIAVAMSDVLFSGGEIDAEVMFSQAESRSTAEIVLWYDPATRDMITAGIAAGGGPMFSIRYFDAAGRRWTPYQAAGRGQNAAAERWYRLTASVRGSSLKLLVDGVETLSVTLETPLPPSQIGACCAGPQRTRIRNYEVRSERATAFVVMQFGGEYDHLYEEVVKPVCGRTQLAAERADDTFGPGLIIADIVRSIDDAHLLVAEVTPANPNVYFEIGYAYARNKPVILLAQIGTHLPFDVAPFRTVFYENSIRGKRELEETLEKHLLAALAQLHASAEPQTDNAAELGSVVT